MSISTERHPVLAYNTAFDRKAYQDFSNLSFLDESEFQRRKEMLDSETAFNLRTHLGERFSVLLSKLRYNVRDGIIYGEFTPEASLDIFIRGRDYRRVHGNPVDFAREDAEIEGFKKIQDVLGQADTPIGSMMLSVSPKGRRDSIYQHNFYDVFTLQEDEQGRYIEAKRFGSALNQVEYSQKLRERLGVDIFPNDASFLANPIFINPKTDYYASADDIHKDFHHGGNFMDTNFFEGQVLPKIEYIAERYIKALNKGEREEKINLFFNAYLNHADKIAFGPKLEIIPSAPMVANNAWMTEREMLFLGKQKVREVMVGCGFSGGAMSGDNIIRGAFSVADFGMVDSKGSLTFSCPSCNQTNTRPYGGIRKNCQHCNVAVAC